MPYLAEYTDTFAGEANYCWVRRAVINHDSTEPYSPRRNRNVIMRKARAALGLTGVKGDITAEYGDEWHWKPRGACTVLMVRYDEFYSETESETC